jgi:hypothetical protein
MGNRSAASWLVLLLAVAAIAVAFFLRNSPDPHMRDIARYLGWAAIVLLIIARFALGRKKQPEPPMPRD